MSPPDDSDTAEIYVEVRRISHGDLRFLDLESDVNAK